MIDGGIGLVAVIDLLVLAVDDIKAVLEVAAGRKETRKGKDERVVGRQKEMRRQPEEEKKKK
jgi:hypothetical protein